LGERLLCKQEVIGSIPFTSTISLEMVEQEILITSSKLLSATFFGSSQPLIMPASLGSEFDHSAFAV
jgi:hypothetical protein